MIALIVCVILVGLMLIGVPVAIAMGITSEAVFAALGLGRILPVMAQRIYNGTTGFTLLAIPFFILAGNLMNTGGITDRIFNFAKAMVGHWPGGLGQVNIFSSVIFSGMSGAAVADAAGLGMIEMKAMDDAGYDHTFSASITAASSTIGPVIPPSIPFVVYSSVTSVSVAKLFAAGFAPGLLMALAMAVAVYVTSKRKGFPVSEKMPWNLRMKYLVEAIPSLLTVVIIIGGIWGGFFTATEAAIVATFYALFLSGVVYRQLTIKKLISIIYDSMITSCKTLFIIAVANFLAYFMIHQKIPNQVIEGLLALSNNPTVLIGIIDMIGMDYVQFGVIMILASMIGLLTPPVGMSLYAVSSITNVPLMKLSKGVLPYVIGIFLVLLLCAYWPPISTVLPKFLG